MYILGCVGGKENFPAIFEAAGFGGLDIEMADGPLAVFPLPLHLGQGGQDEQERDQGVQSEQHQSEACCGEELQSRAGSVDDQVQRAARGAPAGALEVVSEVRVFEAGQALPAVGGANDLFRHIAGEAVTGQTLERGREGLDELRQGEHCRGQSNPGEQGKQGRRGIRIVEQAQVERGAVDNALRQRELDGNEESLQHQHQADAKQEAGT